jgi:alpha-N-arabinofuranosidase
MIGSSVTYGELSGLEGNSIISSENPVIPFAPTLAGWAPIGNVKLSLDSLHPLSDALSTVMQIDIPKGATGEVGFKNFGIRP